MKSRKSVLLVVLVTLSLILGSLVPAAALAARPKAPAAAEPVTIKWVEWWDPEYGDQLMNDLIAGFEAKNPDIKVERTSVPWNNMYDALVANAQATSAEYDVMGMEFEWMLGVDKLGGVEPLDSYVQSAPKEWQAARADGSMIKWMGKTGMIYWYMMPYQVAYNMDIFEQAQMKPPASWEEFADAVCKLRDEKTGQYGYSMPLGQYTPQQWLFFTRLVQYGGKVLDDTGHAAFNSPEGVKSVEWWKKMLESGCVTPGSMSEQIAQSREYFANGKIAMTWDGPFISTISKQVNPKIRVAFAPAWKDVTGGYLWAGSGLALAANSVHKAEGWKFLEYLLSEDVSTMMTNKVSIPFSTKAGFKLLETSDDPILKEIPAMLNQDPKANFFFGPLPDFNSLSQTLQEQFNLAVAGKKDAKVALDEAAVAWNKAIDAAK